jgi:beta-galactosidase
MRLGVAYYPEHAEPEQWSQDLRKIKDAGIERIRIAEFAWSRLEPNQGQFDWRWLDDIVELAAEYDIEVVLCTPTAAPPVWLAEQHPEILPVNSDGKRLLFGKRQSRCYNTHAYVDYSLRIVDEMGKRYGRHPNVVAWQLDNEFGGEQKYCYCRNCEREFQEFLRSRYDGIADLNKRWGNAFWSHDYQRFEQVKVPSRIDAQLWLKYNPSIELEFMRFGSKTIVEYCGKHASLLRRHTEVTITTNTDPFFYGDNVNLVDLFRDLDIGGIDVYSTDLYEIGFYSDIVRSIKSGSFWMMEFGTNSDNLTEEMVQLERMGCEYLHFFKLKPFPWGQEQGTKALLTLTGEPGRNYSTLQRWAGTAGEETAETEPSTLPTLGIYYDFDSSWAYTVTSWDQGTGKWLYPLYMLHTVYKSLFDQNVSAIFVYDEQNLGELEWLVLPWLLLHDETLENSLIRFVHDGGNLVVTDDLFQKNRDNVFLTSVPKIYQEVFGWHQNNFVYPQDQDGTFQIMQSKAGKGRAWMLKKNTDESGWRAFIKEFIT